MPPITVDIWSDIACPWCYIGKRRFEQGVRRFRAEHPDVALQVTYHSFELAPDLPEDVTGTVGEYLSQRKGMPRDQVEQMLEHVTGLARAEGLAYDFDAVRQTRTLKAHELLHLARAHGLQEAMKERLFVAYFEQGRHVGRIDELAELAGEVGLDRDEVVAALESGRYAGAVQADIDQARAYGISGVPFFVLDGPVRDQRRPGPRDLHRRAAAGPRRPRRRRPSGGAAMNAATNAGSDTGHASPDAVPVTPAGGPAFTMLGADIPGLTCTDDGCLLG